MAPKLLNVLIHPNEILRKKAIPVRDFDAALAELADDMSHTMYHYKGIGLAANQVGELKRIFVLDVHWRSDPDEPEKYLKKSPEVFVNPELVSGSGEMEYEEGCLSVPQVYGLITRKETVQVRYQDLKGKVIERNFSDLQAIAFQHELDHLNGILFFDHLSDFKRGLLLQKFLKLQSEIHRNDAGKNKP